MGVADGTGACVCAPVIYPWYCLVFHATPVRPVDSPAALVWTYSVIPVYLVWERALHGVALDRAERADADRIRRCFAVNGSSRAVVGPRDANP